MYKLLVVLILVVVSLYSCNDNKTACKRLTYCNPIDIDYTYQVYNAQRSLSYRSGADPVIINYKDGYYLFVTRSLGYWHSEDLVNWEFIKPKQWFFGACNAPGVVVLGDTVLLYGAPHGAEPFIYSTNPKEGEWEAFPGLVIENSVVPDPGLFKDDDGKVYAYAGSSNKFPIYGMELNPKRMFLPIGKRKELISLHPKEHGWERFGEYYDSDIKPFIEGATMSKHNGKYYLEYAAPGTESITYADGVYTSDSPLGPFTYENYNPVSYKLGGFANGAGHGNTFRDKNDNLWHTATCRISVNYPFERRISIYPSGYTQNGQWYVNTSYGDYPHYMPNEKDDGNLFTGWMLLSYKKRTTASGSLVGYGSENVTDENIQSAWVTKKGEKERWITIDLEDQCTIFATQVNFFDYKTDLYGKHQLSHQYILQHSNDGKKWDILLDKSKNIKDEPNDYEELQVPVKARYIKYIDVNTPNDYLAISGLRVFGRGSGETPAKVKNFRLGERKDNDVHLSWDKVKEAQGYMIYFDINPNNLYHSIMVYDSTQFVVGALNKGVPYYFQIEPFNENGIGERSEIITLK